MPSTKPTTGCSIALPTQCASRTNIWLSHHLILVDGDDPLAEVLTEQLPAESGALAAGFLNATVQAMPGMPDDLPTFLHEGAPLSPLAHQYFEALRRGERHLASQLVLAAVEAGTPVKEIYLNVFQPAQYQIGRLWQTNRITVAQEHYCTAATQLIMSQLYSYIFATAKNGRTLVATRGPLHRLAQRSCGQAHAGQIEKGLPGPFPDTINPNQTFTPPGPELQLRLAGCPNLYHKEDRTIA